MEFGFQSHMSLQKHWFSKMKLNQNSRTQVYGFCFIQYYKVELFERILSLSPCVCDGCKNSGLATFPVDLSFLNSVFLPWASGCFTVLRNHKQCRILCLCKIRRGLQGGDCRERWESWRSLLQFLVWFLLKELHLCLSYFLLFFFNSKALFFPI